MRRRIHKIILLLTVLGLCGSSALGFDLVLQGDRLTLRAEDVALRAILDEFARRGVSVRIDPTINKRVTVDVVDTDLYDALDRILRPLTYVLVWDVMPGPVGDLPRLKEIQAFQPGKRDAARPIAVSYPNLRVVRDSDTGTLVVADEILIRVKPGTTVAAFNKLLKPYGAGVVDSFAPLGIYRLRLPPGSEVGEIVKKLRESDIVHTVEPNYAAKSPPPERSEHKRPTTGRGVTLGPPPANSAAIAILDSGLLPGAGLTNLLVAHYDAFTTNVTLADAQGHGTQMALIASGAVDPSGMTTDAGVAGVPLIPVRTFDENGMASSLAIVDGIRFAVENGARVINLSWGMDGNSQFLREAIDYAIAQDVVVVAAAGNEPTGRAVYPAAYPGVVAASATLPDGTLWERSNFGSFVGLAAPAVADLPVGFNGPPGVYAGTSIASAYVANVVSRYRTKHPEATRAQLMDALAAALTDAGAPGRDDRFGGGALDAQAVSRFLGGE